MSLSTCLTQEPKVDNKVFLSNAEEILTGCLELLKRKNQDYANTQEFNDALKNFKLCETIGICSAEKGILVRMCDKISRASTLLSTDPQVQDEKIQDTLTDVINYTIILMNLLKDKKSNGN